MVNENKRKTSGKIYSVIYTDGNETADNRVRSRSLLNPSTNQLILMQKKIKIITKT